MKVCSTDIFQINDRFIKLNNNGYDKVYLVRLQETFYCVRDFCIIWLREFLILALMSWLSPKPMSRCTP